MRTFAIGDIHGHLRLLDGLLAQIGAAAASGDGLVFLGDYVDRGPESYGVVERIVELQNGGWEVPYSRCAATTRTPCS